MRYLLPLAVAALALSACGSNETEEVSSRAPDPLESQLANAAPVELPPPVRANASFRCSDNSLVFVDFFQGDKQVNLRTERNGAPTRLTAAEAGQPYEGEGYTVEGTPEKITYTRPGKPALTCNA